MKTMTSGVILYRGPSAIDGAPIVAVMTYRSRNVKTGNMAQVFIIRGDMHPLDALADGSDVSICGNCRHRPDASGKRSCYVNAAQAPASVYRGVQRGIYPMASDIAAEGRGRIIRLGAYGDPAAVPVDVWRALVSEAAGWTGYSHQWQESRFAALRAYCMASVDNEVEYSAAVAMGWRAFRVRIAGQPLAQREIVCPASDEGGKRTQCAACMLCSGAAKQAKNIAVVAHGIGAKHFTTA